MTSTGTTSMTYNASSARFRIKKQQDFARRKVDQMIVRSDAASFFFSDTSGPSKTIPFADYTNLFTNKNGSIYPTLSRLGNSFKIGSKWSILGEGTKLKYEGDAFIGQVQTYISLRPDASDNRILSLPVTDGGSGYTTAPTVSFSGAGSGAAATAILNEATQVVASISITNGGTGWANSGTTASLSGAPGSATVGTPVVGKVTQVYTAIYKNNQLMDNDTVSSIIGDPANTFTSSTEMRYVGSISKGDIFEFKVKTDSTADHVYHIYQAVLSILPLELAT